MTCFVLGSSPALGVWSMEPLARALEAAGAPSTVIGTTPRRGEGTDAYRWLTHRLIVAAEPGDVLVLHDGAGALAALAAARGRFSRIVLVDALLPHPGRSWLETLPEGVAERLLERAEDGLLPPWIDWQDGRELARIWPNPQLRETLRRSLPRVSAAFAQALAPAAPPPPADRCVCLQLSAAYGEACAAAESLGWETASLPMHHLAMLTDPETVAQALLAAEEPDAGEADDLDQRHAPVTPVQEGEA